MGHHGVGGAATGAVKEALCADGDFFPIALFEQRTKQLVRQAALFG
jgi:hypothetical protein